MKMNTIRYQRMTGKTARKWHAIKDNEALCGAYPTSDSRWDQFSFGKSPTCSKCNARMDQLGL